MIPSFKKSERALMAPDFTLIPKLVMTSKMGEPVRLEVIEMCSQEEKRTFIVCPKMMLYSWSNYIKDFGNKSYEICESGKPIQFQSSWTLISYELLRQRKELFLSRFWDTMIIDNRANKLRDGRSAHTKLVKELMEYTAGKNYPHIKQTIFLAQHEAGW